jgi:5-methylcytosine-specific restriction endonuclease McrA
MTSLEVHHQQFRSQQGHDSDENLITLCHTCHTRLHGRCTS